MILPDYVTVYIGSRKYKGGQECPDEIIAKDAIERAEQRYLTFGASVEHPGIIEQCAKGSKQMAALMHKGRLIAGNFFSEEEEKEYKAQQKSEKDD